MNVYIDLPALKAAMGITSTANDSVLLANAEAASRLIDAYTHRQFYVSEAPRYFDTHWRDLVLIDDCLGLTALTSDSDLDATFDGTTWAAQDYYLWPDNRWPKREIRLLQGGRYRFRRETWRYLKAVGTWGYAETQNPFAAESVTATVADATSEAITLSATPTVIGVGHTIKIGAEQMFIRARTGANVTATRGVNGTTATAHSAASVFYMRYPAQIAYATQWLATLWFNERASPNLRMQMIGEYQEMRGGGTEMDRTLSRLIGSFGI